MKTGDEGLELIKGFEKLELEAYPDPGSADGRPWTIGYGTTEGVQEGDVCTEEQAEEWLALDLENAENVLRNSVKVGLNQNQFDALVSFVYNVGAAAFKGSTLLRKLNNGSYIAAAAEFGRWNKNNGKVMRGLTRRREAEERLFLRQT